MEALIVAATPKQQHALCDVLYAAKMDCVVCSCAAEARRAALCRQFDLFVVNGGLPDEPGDELAGFIADSCDCGGVYIDDFARCDMFADGLADCGVITLMRPVTKSALSEAVRMIAVANTRLRAVKKRCDELAEKLEDAKYINRAKIVLMRTLGYSEEQAHKHIEKTAMDMRISRRKVALDILKTYEA